MKHHRATLKYRLILKQVHGEVRPGLGPLAICAAALGGDVADLRSKSFSNGAAQASSWAPKLSANRPKQKPIDTVFVHSNISKTNQISGSQLGSHRW
jgi:hypothetical protein